MQMNDNDNDDDVSLLWNDTTEKVKEKYKEFLTSETYLKESKNAQRRILRSLIRKELHLAKEPTESLKDQKKRKRQVAREKFTYKRTFSRNEEKNLKNELKQRLAAVRESNPKIVVDMAFVDEMSYKTRMSLYLQLQCIHAHARTSVDPCNFMLTGVSENVRHEIFSKLNVNETTWPEFQYHSQGFEELVPKENIVYLTADSEHDLENFESDKTYIIGGIVDRNRMKGATAEKSKTMGIATARLPLDAYYAKKDHHGKKVLTVNQVSSIILDHLPTHSWEYCLDRHLPIRGNKEVQHIVDKESSWQFSDTKPKVCWVLGGTSGIGFEFAKQFRAHGWTVVLVGRSIDKLDAAAKQLRSFPPAVKTSLEPLVMTFCEDLSRPVGYLRMESVLFNLNIGNVSAVIASMGTFKWDDHEFVQKDPQFLHHQNFHSKRLALRTFLTVLAPHIKYFLDSDKFEQNPEDAPSDDGHKKYFVVVGSDAGKPDFTERVPDTDGELKYIESMRELHAWSANITPCLENSVVQYQFIEPPLVDTQMAREEFQRLNIDWSTIPSASAFVEDVLKDMNMEW